MSEHHKTKLHRAAEMVATQGKVDIHVGLYQKTKQGINAKLVQELEASRGRLFVNREQFVRVIELAYSIPNFYLDQTLFDNVKREDINSCLRAMDKAGILRLPFPQQLIEYKDIRQSSKGISENHCFMMIAEAFDREAFPGEVGLHPYQVIFWIMSKVDGEERMILSPSIINLRFDEHADVGDGTTDFGIHYIGSPAPYIELNGGPELAEAVTRAAAADARSAGRALGMLILLLNTRGIKKEVIVPEKLNKARRKSGKFPVPAQTILRVGTVYDRSGVGQTVDADGLGKDRKPVRVHWRKGHTRIQRIGKGRTGSKEVFIEPTLVNWSGEEDEYIKPYRAKVVF